MTACCLKTSPPPCKWTLLKVSGRQNDVPSFRKGKIELQSDQKRRPVLRTLRLGKSFPEKRLCLGVLWPPALDAAARRVSGSLPEAFQKLPRCFQKAPNCQNLAPKGSRPGFGPKRPFPNSPRRRVYLPAGKPANCQNLAPKGSRPGFGPKTAVSQ